MIDFFFGSLLLQAGQYEYFKLSELILCALRQMSKKTLLFLLLISPQLVQCIIGVDTKLSMGRLPLENVIESFVR